MIVEPAKRAIAVAITRTSIVIIPLSPAPGLATFFATSSWGLRPRLYSVTRVRGFKKHRALVRLPPSLIPLVGLLRPQKLRHCFRKLLRNRVHRVVLLTFEHDQSPIRQSAHQRFIGLLELW